MIAHSLRKIHISGNREKTVQRLKYQCVDYFYGSKIMESYLKKKVLSDPVSPLPTIISLPKTTKE